MEAANSLELDDAIFPQPPQDVSTVGNMLYGGAMVADTPLAMTNFKDEDTIDSLPEILKDERPKESLVTTDKEADDETNSPSDNSVLKKTPRKRKSRIRRILDGIGLTKTESDSSSGDESDSSIEDSSEAIKLNEKSVETKQDDAAIANRNGLTRIIQRVQTKANRMWETIGNKLGGRIETEKDESSDESSRETSLSLSEMKRTSSNCVDGDSIAQDVQGSEETKVAFISQGHSNDDVPMSKDEPGEGLSPNPGPKPSTLKRFASGFKNGLLPKWK